MEFTLEEAKRFLADHGQRRTQIRIVADTGDPWPDMPLRTFLEKVRDDQVVVREAKLLVYGASDEGGDMKIAGLEPLRQLIEAL